MMTLKNPDGVGLFTTSDTTDDVLLTQIGDSVKTKGRRRAVVEIGTSGGSDIDFDQFAVQGRVKGGSGTWHTLKSAWVAATDEDEVLIDAPTNLAALARGDTEFAIMDFNGFAEIRALSAQAGVTASPVTRNLKIVFAGHKGGN